MQVLRCFVVILSCSYIVFAQLNYDCEHAVPVQRDVQYVDDTALAIFSLSNLKYPTCGTSAGPVLFYSYVTQTDYFPLAISTCNGSAYNTYITVYTGSCLSLSCLASDDNSCENSPLRSTIRFEDTSALPAGTFLLIAVSGPAPTDLGQFTLKVTEGTLNDVCERRIPMENREIVQGNTISTLNTLASVGYPVCGSTSSQNTEVLFYEYVISMEPSSFMVSTCLGATNWDTYLSVYSHDNCSLMSCEDSNDDNCRFYRSTVILENYANGTQLLIAIHGYNNRYSESGPFSMVAQETPYNQSCDTSFEIIEGEISFGYISNNMATLADRGMISCIGSYYDSTPAAFFYYVTTKNFSPIMINVCGQFTDYENTQQVEVLTGDCNNLSCVATGVCWVALDPLYPAGTRLTIIVHDDDYYYYSRIFNIYVEEEPYPIGYDCENAMVLENQVPVFGNSTIAPNTFTTGSPAVFFHYTTQYDYSYIYISACRSLFPALVSTFSGPCHNLYNETGYDYGWMADCLQMFNHFYDDYYFQFGLPIGTELTIVVEGINSTDHGMFQLFVDERENTYPNKLSSCETAIPLSNNAVITGNNYDFNFLIELGYPECHGIPDFQNVSIVFYEYTTAYNFGTVVVSTCGSFYDTLLSVYTGPCGSLSCLAASDDACGDDAKAVITTLTKGTRILIGVQPYDRYQVGPFQLSVHEDLPITSNCSNAYRAYSGDLLDGETRNVSSTLNSYGYPSCGGTGMDSPSVLIKYQSTINFGNILFSLCNAGTTFDTVLHVYTHNSCGGVTCVATNNNACGLQSKIQLTEQYPANTQFLIAVHGTNPAQYGNFSLSIKETRPSPVNDVCSAAIVLSNMQTVSGYSESSISLASSLPSCGIQQHQSPVVFYKYTTQYPNGEIHIRTCNTANFDTVIRLYKGTCAALQCVKMEDDSPGCGTTTSLTLLPAEGVPVGTNLLIAVHGYNQAFGDFQLFFEEINLGRRPSNELCVTSIAASQGNTQGFTDGSLTGSASLPTCNGSGNQNSPVVFYHYTSSISFSTIHYSVCSATFTSRIAIYRGTCASLQCVPPVTSGTCEAVIKDNNLQFPAGTRFTIAVFGATTHSGNFTLNIQESAVCNPTGATITCPNNVTMTTDHSCNLGLQCATIPSGTANCVDLPTCSCTTAQVSGPEAGTEVVAGTYTRTYRATNNIGAVSTCSYNIQVSNECNPNGPTMSCNSGPYIFETSTNCFINNLPCYPLTSIPLGTCTDNFGSCDCEVYQVSGPVEGEQLTEGNYTIISEAKNKLNITSQSKCEIQIVVKNVFVPQEPSPQISTNVDPTQSRTKTQTPTRTPIPKSPTPTPTSAANANQQCQNCQTGNTQTMLGSNTTNNNNNNEETVVNLVTDSGQPVGSISVPPNLVQGTGSLSVSYVEAPRNGNARVGGVILDITLQDQFGGDITKLNSPLTVCIEETGNSNQEDDLCLGYYDVDERSWICEDECLEQENNMYCGQTDHLTSFALLLGGNGGGSGDPCDSNAIDYAYAWASLAVVGFAIIVIIIVILAWELRFQHRNHQAKTVFRNQASKISQHM